MARVIPFPLLNMPRAEVIAYYERLLMRAKRGEIQGVLSVLSIADGPDEMGICGVLAEDLGYATSAAQVAFGCLVGQSVGELPATETPSKEKRG